MIKELVIEMNCYSSHFLRLYINKFSSLLFQVDRTVVRLVSRSCGP